MTDRQTKTWNRTVDAILGSALALAIAIGGYYVNQLDKRDAAQNTKLETHGDRILTNEKDIEYAKKQLEKIDSMDKKLDMLLQELRK